MAKQYHPLDVRYKGPSTAYTGSKSQVSKQARFEQPAARPAPKAATPPPPPASGPWDAGVAPRPDGPPPMPRARPVPKRRRARARVFLALAVMAVIVAGNLFAARQYQMFTFEVGERLNGLDSLMTVTPDDL